MKLRSSLISNRTGIALLLLMLCLGAAVAQAQTATLSRSALNFGPVLIGQSVTSNVSLKNTGTAVLNIGSIASGTAAFPQSNNCGSTLAPGAACTITLTFAPAANGVASDTLTVTDDATAGPQTMNLAGTGITPAYLSGVNFSFGSQVVTATSAAQTVTVTNRQATPLAVSTSISGDFAIQANTCGSSIPASGTCTISMAFTPTVAGARSGSLTMTPSVGPVLMANLTGTGVQQFTLSPSALSFGSQATGTASAVQTVTLKNTQASAMPVSAVSASAGFGQTNTCGSSLAGGSSCTFSVSFAPTDVGSVTGSLSFAVGSAATPQSVSLSGTGVAPYTVSATSVAFGNQALGTTSAPQLVTVANKQSVALGIFGVAISTPFSQTNTCGSSLAAGASCSFYVTFTPAGSSNAAGSLSFALSNGASPVAVSLSGSGVVPFTIAPNTLAMGNVAIGSTSAAQTVTVTNKQSVPLGISSVAISSGFSQTNTCGSSLAVGASCAFSVTFSPGALGSAAGSLSFGVSNGVSPQVISLSGTGIVPVTITPASIMFGPQIAGLTSAPATVNVKNNQSGPLGITGISVTGPFAQTNTCGISLAAGASCKISVTMTPLSMGVFTGSLTINDDAATLPTTVIGVTGTGVAPMYLSTVSLSFGSQALGGVTAAKTITVKNNASVAFSISGIAIIGDFTQTNNCPATLAGGASCTVNVVFAPSLMGTRTGTLTITDTAINSPLVANLSGVGAAGLTSITVTPASISLGIGAQQQFVATGKYSDNSTKDVTNSVIWTSGNAAVGINVSGLAEVFSTPDISIPITATSGGIVSAPAWLSALSTLPRVCSTPTIDMKLLVVTNGKTEADFPAVKQILDYLGTPYTVFDMTVETSGITSSFLSDGACHGYYQGVIFTYGSYIYTLPGMSNLTSYEQTFKVRQLNWFTYPGTDFGLNTATGTISSNSTYSASFTAAGAQVFPYANTATPLAISNAAVYLATAVSGGASTSTSTGGTNITGTPVGPTATPLLQDSTGHALSVVNDFGDGRQYLSQTFDSNQYLTHDLVLAYGLINWVTKGIFLGEYHVYASASVDDFFINDSEWVPGTACTNPITHDRTASDDPSLPTFRLKGADMTALVNWQNSKNHDPLLANFKLSLAFNGVGTAGNTDWTGVTTAGVANDDLLTSFPSYQQYFHWMSHTYDHPETLDGLTKSGPADPNGDTIDLEILTNLWVAGAAGGVNLDTDSSDSGLRQLSFTDFDAHAMVTPGVTGLDDPNSSQYLYQDGIFYVVSDTSVTPTATNNNGPNPSPNVGIVNSFAPGIYEVPRHANDVYFNAANWNDDAAEFHCIYGPEGSNQTPYSNYTPVQILDFVSTSFVNNMLLGDMDPQMFHQPNLHAYDGTHSMIGDTYDQTFSKYEALYKLPVLSPTQAQTAQLMQARNNYNLSGVTATLVGGSSPTITIEVPAGGPVSSAVVPVTGLNSTGAEVYGGTNISHVNATAGIPVTLPVQ